jgi:hypothetical protein
MAKGGRSKRGITWVTAVILIAIYAIFQALQSCHPVT